MLTLISPAKTLDFDSPVKTDVRTEPEFLSAAAQLVDRLRKLRPKQLGQLMHLSDKLAELNHMRFQDWDAAASDDGVHPAMFAFRGDVYRGLKADDLTPKQIEYAQDHLRMLSGLYGVLRPLDRMLPYRLEMGTSLKNGAGKDLYAFWGSRITESINRQAEQTKSKWVLNLASQEYFKSVRPRELERPVIAPAFKEIKDGKPKMIAIFAKLARGTMASWVIRNKVRTPKKLMTFAEDGYRLDPALSTPQAPVFTRQSGKR